MKRLDFTNPTTIKKAADFPFYGQAQALLRVIDPLWKLDLTEEHGWRVTLERNAHFCDCEFCTREDRETKREIVRACTPEEAEAEALARDTFLGWEVVSVQLLDGADIAFPEWIYETAGEA